MSNEAKASMLQYKKALFTKHIEGWTLDIEALQDKIKRLERWIAIEQGNLEDAQTMLDELEKKP